jgi:hypothetical protein
VSRPGADKNAPPSYDAIIFACGFASNTIYSLQSRVRASSRTTKGSRSPSFTDSDPSSKGFRNSCKKMYNRIKGAHHHSHVAELHDWAAHTIPKGTHELSASRLVPLEMESPPAELYSPLPLSSTSQFLFELPAPDDSDEPSVSLNHGLYQQPPSYSGSHDLSSSARVMNNEMLRHLYDDRHGRNHMNIYTSQQHWSQQPADPNTFGQTTLTSAWTLSPHSEQPHQSPVTTTSISRIDPPAAWNNGVNRHDACSHSLPTYLASPPYGELEHGFETEHSISPVSGHSAQTAGTSGTSTFPLTPPTASPSNPSIAFSPIEKTFRSFQKNASGPSSQSLDELCLAAIPATTTYGNGRFDATSPTKNIARCSLWERQISAAQRSHRNDAFVGQHQAHSENAGATNGSKRMLPFTEDTLGPPHGYGYAKHDNAKPRRSPAASFIKNVLAPLVCGHCKVEFNGEYQKGNLARHIRRFHSAFTLHRCRSCPKVYKRDDARRKHEWKKHDAEDCCPDKRRPEKRAGENRRMEKRKIVGEGGKEYLYAQLV